MAATYHGILIHVVFSTKMRMRLLARSWQDDLYGYMGAVAQDNSTTLIKAGGVEDHVHLFLKIHPKVAIADTLRGIKAHSSKWINLSGRVRGKFHWQRGYAAFSVSESLAPAVVHYIERQEEHHRRQTFRDEYIALLRKHNIAFDPDHLFDDEFCG